MKAIVRSVLLIAAVCAMAPSSAQIRLPRLPARGVTLPSLPTDLQPFTDLPDEVTGAVRPLVSSVRTRARELLRRYPDQVERDPQGQPIVRSVIIALSPDEQALQQAQMRGFEIESDQTLQPLGGRVVTLIAPPRMSTQRALRELRAADPSGSYDFDHLFVAMQAAPPREIENPSGNALPEAVDIRVGLIDGGVEAEHPVFATRRPQLSGCGGKPMPDKHGTAVASLFVGQAPEFHGAAPGAELIAADIYCGAAAPGGRVRDIVVALAGLVAARVRVINMSIVGPDNAVLGAVVRKVLAQSIVIVAASGNDGPRAAPLYPAAYPGVVAVTAVDAHEKVLMEASGGDYVRFAAPGADMLAATLHGKYAAVRGTSFASPLVAGLIARLLAREDSSGVEQVVRELAATAADHGKPRRRSRYSYLVGMELRTDPAQFSGRAAPE